MALCWGLASGAGPSGAFRGQVKRLVRAERHARGVGLAELFIAEVRPHVVEAFPAVTRAGPVDPMTFSCQCDGRFTFDSQRAASAAGRISSTATLGRMSG